MKIYPSIIFSLNYNGDIQKVRANIVNNIILIGEQDVKSKLIDDFKDLLELRGVGNGPGEMRSFALIQIKEMIPQCESILMTSYQIYLSTGLIGSDGNKCSSQLMTWRRTFYVS